MSRPRTNAAGRMLVLLLMCIVSSTLGVSIRVYAQQQADAVAEDTARGIEMYRKNDPKGAIETLSAVVKKRPDDAYAWHYLGLALLNEGDLKASRKDFETAIKLKPDFILAHVSLARLLLRMTKWRDAARAAERLLAVNPQNAEAHYLLGEARFGAGAYQKALKEADSALFIDPKAAPAFLLKSRALLANMEEKTAGNHLSEVALTNLFKEAAANLERYINFSPNDPELPSLRKQLELLRTYAGINDLPADQRMIYGPDEVTTKARILSKPEPGYTQEARMNQVTGTVLLRAVLSVDGTVQNILTVSALGHGLTEKCIEAARKIKFIPATKDGRRVSQVVKIEYNFNIY
jgi:TonB family protein